MNYYRRYMGDYAKKTGSLSLAEHGAYTLLLDQVYSTELPLPADLWKLYRLCRAMNQEEQDAVKSVAEAFFPVGEDGFRHNARAVEELTIAQPAILASRTNGVKGGRPKKNPPGFREEPSNKPNGGHPPTTILQPPSLSLKPPLESKSLSSKLDVAKRLLAFLNEQTGKNFQPVKANLDLIQARLAEYDENTLRGVIVDRVDEWSKDDKMREYLRPETLFGARKCAQYVGGLPQ